MEYLYSGQSGKEKRTFVSLLAEEKNSVGITIWDNGTFIMKNVI